MSSNPLLPPADKLDLPEVPGKQPATTPISTLPPQFRSQKTVERPLPHSEKTSLAAFNAARTAPAPPAPVKAPAPRTYQVPQNTAPPPAPVSVPYFQERQPATYRPTLYRAPPPPPPPPPQQPQQSDDFLQHLLIILQTAAESLDERPGTSTAYQVGHAIEALGAIIPNPEIRESYRDYQTKYPIHNYLSSTADCLGWIYAALELPAPQSGPYNTPSQFKMREDMGYPAQESTQRPMFPYIPPTQRLGGVLGTPANYRVGFNKQHARSLERLQYSAQRYRRSSQF
jgi:hypothetical protein